MTGLEKIISRIQEEAKAAAEEKIQAARDEAARILAEAEKDCAAAAEDAERQAALLKAAAGSRAASSAEQARKLTLLRTKQEIIAEILEEASARLRGGDAESYFLTMEKILKEYALPEDGEIWFSAADLERMPAGFEKKIQAAAKEKGGSLKLRKEPKDIRDGFVLVYGGVEENCTLQALAEAKRDVLQDKVNEIMFV